MPVTLQDVARYCGMDISTISRGLRGDARVKPATQEKIRAAADTLGYVPNFAARTLAAGKTGTVWFIVPRLNKLFEREPVEHAARFLLDAGYDLLAGIYHYDPEVRTRLVNRLHQGVADGALIIPSGMPDELPLYGRLLDKGFPLVFLDRHPEGTQAPVVATDNRNAVRDLIRSCADAGAQRAVVLYAGSNNVDRIRLDTALEEMGRRGMARVTADDADTGTGALAVIGTNQRSVTAFVGGNADRLKGQRLVYGVFDGWTGDPHPADVAFSVSQDFEAMARRAVDLVLAMISTGERPRAGVDAVPVAGIETVRPVFG